MTRRSKTGHVFSSTSGDEAAGGGSGNLAPVAGATQLSVAIDDGKSPARDVDGGGGVGATTRLGKVDTGAEGDATENQASENEPPPFTMALAVMLSGLRLFVVDQVRFLVFCRARLARATRKGLFMYSVHQSVAHPNTHAVESEAGAGN